MFRALLKANRRKHARYLLSGNELQNGVIRRVCNMWFNPLNHKGNKDWVDRQLTEHAPTGPAQVSNGPTATSVGEAIQMKNPGYRWEDGTILTVYPDDRALVRWASGSSNTVPKRKIAPTLRTAHVTETSPAGITRGPRIGKQAPVGRRGDRVAVRGPPPRPAVRDKRTPPPGTGQTKPLD